MSFNPKVQDYLAAGNPCLFLKTISPYDAEESVRQAIKDLGIDCELAIWKATANLRVGEVEQAYTDMREMRDIQDIVTTLKYPTFDNNTNKKPIVLVLHHIRQFIADFQFIQQLLESIMYVRIKGSHIIFIGAELDFPPELMTLITVIDYPLPTREQIKDEYKKLIEGYQDDIDINKENIDNLIESASNSAVGLDLIGAENAMALSLATTGTIDISIIQKQKEQEIKKSNVLEFIDINETLDNVGGFGELKDWLKRREKVFTKEAREFGLPFPKGILIAGVAGCLSGDTKICVRRGNRKSGRQYAMSYVFYMLASKKWDINTDTYLLALKDKYLGFHKMKNIISSGKKEVFLVKTEDGREIKATMNHKFKVSEKNIYVKLSELKVGDYIVCRFGLLHTIDVKIVEITKVGIEETFDVIMEDPYRNFIANSIVVHNSGKSLCAKAVASYLKLPLIRLDMGSVFSSLVGSSEERMRTALKIVDTVSPAVLWIDELEKGMAGSKGSGNLDSGVTARVTSTLLTWRQETKSPIFLVATANEVEAIPSPLLRKGRIDEIWATDLPNFDERKEILNIHLIKRNRNPKNFDINKLSKLTENLVGSEIESCIEDGMFYAFDAQVELKTEHIIKAINSTIPQAIRDAEEIAKIRKWIKERARNVSKIKAIIANDKRKIINTKKTNNDLLNILDAKETPYGEN